MSTKGQVVIPKEIRDKLGITPRTKLRVYEQDGKVILEPSVDPDGDPWDGMEFLNFEGSGDQLVRDALRGLGRELVDGGDDLP
ncbi:MAG: AbrB/MazE/SpoVT family DNA-binding domain-containing protein [Promethearchaeota archaeon]